MFIGRQIRKQKEKKTKKKEKNELKFSHGLEH